MSLCISTVVNKSYQKYIPLFVYFCLKSYPKYGIRILLTEKLNQKYVNIIRELQKLKGDFKFYEECFIGYSKIGQQLKTLRWLIDKDYFDGYDNVYIGDIDILICKETPSLEEQHLNNCKILELPYSNIVRKSDKKRLSGLHFMKKEEYYNIMYSIIRKYSLLLKQGKLKHYGNEETLYNMIGESNLGFPIGQWRPHHGIHIGIWRKGFSNISEAKWGDIGGRNVYKEYYMFYKTLKDDDLFIEINKKIILLEIKAMELYLSREFKI